MGRKKIAIKKITDERNRQVNGFFFFFYNKKIYFFKMILKNYKN